MEQQNYMVYVSCMTYNHAPYITDALNGFCIQETNFPFVCTIIDDASTDGEQEIIKKYLQEHFDLEDKAIVRNEETDDYILTFARHKTNINCFFAVLYLKYNHYSIKKTKMPYVAEWRENCKYIALCEGDDYWIVKNKLQTQFESLENNNNATLVHTGFMCVDEKGNPITRKFYEKIQKESFSGNFLPTMFQSNHVMTLTIMFKKSVIESRLYLECPIHIDYCLALCASSLGDIIFLPDKYAAYRFAPRGQMLSNRANVDKQLYSTFKYYAKCFVDGRLRKVSIFSEFHIYINIFKKILAKNDKNFAKYILNKKRWVALLYYTVKPVYIVKHFIK